MTQFRIVLQVFSGTDPEAAPAPWQIARICRLRPPKQEEVVSWGDAERAVKPAVGLRVPLDLRIRCPNAARRTREEPEGGEAQTGEIGAVIHAHKLVDELHIPPGADRPGRVGGRGI